MVSAGAYRGMTEDGEGEPRRVVITGLGAVTAAGATLSDYWAALCEGRVCTSALTAFDAPRAAAAGQVPNEWQGTPGAPDWLLARMDRASQLALDAAIQAQADARIVFNEQNAFAVGAVTGTAHPSGGEGFAALGSGLSGASVGLNIAGPVFTVAMGGASGLASVVLATQLIRSGIIRAAIAIGAEAPLREEIWSAYESAGLLDASDDPAAYRPFDVNRQGMILGEGAAALMLEDRQLATQRGRACLRGGCRRGADLGTDGRRACPDRRGSRASSHRRRAAERRDCARGHRRAGHGRARIEAGRRARDRRDRARLRVAHARTCTRPP